MQNVAGTMRGWRGMADHQERSPAHLVMPDHPVVSGDGSAMYSIQALWTAAHDKLAIVSVILSNWECGILKHNVDV